MQGIEATKDEGGTRDVADAEDGRRCHNACMLSYGARKDLGQPDLACGAGCGDRLRGALAMHQAQRKRATLKCEMVGSISETALGVQTTLNCPGTWFHAGGLSSIASTSPREWPMCFLHMAAALTQQS